MRRGLSCDHSHADDGYDESHLAYARIRQHDFGITLRDSNHDAVECGERPAAASAVPQPGSAVSSGRNRIIPRMLALMTAPLSTAEAGVGAAEYASGIQK